MGSGSVLDSCKKLLRLCLYDICSYGIAFYAWGADAGEKGVSAQPPNAELSVKYENTRVFVEKMIKFLQMSKVDFIQHSKEKVCQYTNLITNYLDEVRMKNSAALQKHLQQLQLELSHPKASLLNSSAETLSRSSKRPMHQYIISWQQNANISASSSQSSSQSEQELKFKATSACISSKFSAIFSTITPSSMSESPQKFPEMLVLQLLVLANYPKASPIVLDKSPDLFSTEEVRNGYREVKLRFNLSLRQLSEPMSIREMAKTWDICARQVFAEFNLQSEWVAAASAQYAVCGKNVRQQLPKELGNN
nr:Mediator of RNA polymerase II transcription subunit 15A [Ipomoea batatas]